MVQEYRNTWLEDEGYDYNYYLYVEEASKLISTYIEELGEEKYEKIQNAVNTSFSDEDIEKMEIGSYAPFKRGGVIFSILEYNYDYQTGTFKNKDAIIDLCPGGTYFLL